MTLVIFVAELVILVAELVIFVAELVIFVAELVKSFEFQCMPKVLTTSATN